MGAELTFAAGQATSTKGIFSKLACFWVAVKELNLSCHNPRGLFGTYSATATQVLSLLLTSSFWEASLLSPCSGSFEAALGDATSGLGGLGPRSAQQRVDLFFDAPTASNTMLQAWLRRQASSPACCFRHKPALLAGRGFQNPTARPLASQKDGPSESYAWPQVAEGHFALQGQARTGPQAS